MIRVLFICHGNICRSPMAEYIFKDMVKKRGMADEFEIASAATSREEIWDGVGNPVHQGTKKILDRLGIDCGDKRAVQMTAEDYDRYDLLIGMDKNNLRNIRYIVGCDTDNKIKLLLDYTDRPGDVADPWYTGDFESTYRDIILGCEGLLTELIKKNEN